MPKTDFGSLPHVGVNCDDPQFREALRSVVLVLRSASARYSVIQDELEEENKKSSDILHYIELHSNVNAAQGYKLYAMLAESRRRRRALKNELTFLEPVCKFLDGHRNVPELLSFLHGQCNSIAKDYKDAVYNIKTEVLDELPKEGI